MFSSLPFTSSSVAQTYCKLTLLIFVFSSPQCLDNVPFSILVGGRYITILLHGDGAAALQTADSAGLLLDAEELPSLGMLHLSKEMHHISSKQHGVGGPRHRGLCLGVVVWQVCWHGSSLLAFGWVLKQVTQSP